MAQRQEGRQARTASEKYKRFDAADYLETLDDVAAFLEAALEDSTEDPTAVPQALGIIARSQNMKEMARRAGMSRDGLHKALSADGNPTWSTILNPRAQQRSAARNPHGPWPQDSAACGPSAAHGA